MNSVEPQPALEVLASQGGDDIAVIVGRNLRRLRTRKGLSLERLAKASGVSRAMLGQIELGRSAPTINVLWKIACALGVRFSAFTSGHTENGVTIQRSYRAKWLGSGNGRFQSRALFPAEAPHKAEFYELHIAAQTVELEDPHPPGTTENLVVSAGMVELVVGGETYRLEAGDAIHFVADLPHAYRNPGQVKAVLYMVVCYPEPR